MEQLQVFSHDEFGSVRTLLIGNEPYFVGKDVTDISAFQDLCGCLTCGKIQVYGKLDFTITDDATIRNESGLYSLILSSKLPAAKRFKHWITSEVLPAIRKHGVYAVDEVLNNPDLLLSALEALKQEREAARSLQETVDAQQELLTVMEPKAAYYDKVLACPEALPITVIAKDYGWSARKMNLFLQEAGVQFRLGKTWLLYAAFAGKGYTKSETILYTDQCGDTHPYLFTKWTQKGRLMIYELMKAAGYEPKEDHVEEEANGDEG